MHRTSILRRSLGFLFVLSVSCTTAPDAFGPTQSIAMHDRVMAGCDTVCVLVEGEAPFHSLEIPVDSADSEALLARAVWDHLASGVVRLRLVGATTLSPEEASQRVRLTGIVTQQPTLADLVAGIEFDVTEGADSLGLTILRNRSLHVAAAANLQLVLWAPQAPRAVTTPWPRRVPVSALVIRNDAECDFVLPETGCGEDVTATPSVVIPSVGNGTFQSFGGTNASRRMEVVFSAPVASVTVTIHDPTYSGNSVSAISATGALLASRAFTGNNQPGVYSADIKTVSAPPSGERIKRIILIPADLDYVAYSMSFQVGQVDFTVECLPATIERGQTVLNLTRFRGHGV